MLHERILLIRDENALGSIYNEFQLSFSKIEISARDIITERVYQEVTLYNQQAAQYKYALVQPTAEEIQLNNLHSKPKKLINAEQQVEIALAAFESNGFFLLVDDKQLEQLDELVPISDNTVISFIKLTALVGG